jgi:P-type Cu+ transporter
MNVRFAYKNETKTQCFHCGEPCQTFDLVRDEKYFCCQGCAEVYQLLQENQLCEYYDLNDKAGVNRRIGAKKEKFAYLDLPEVQAKLLSFSDGKTAKLTLFIPTIHCSSCIWLLEHLYKLNPNIGFSQINFLKKQLFVSFEIEKIKLSEVVATLASIGYEPLITLNDTDAQSDSRKDEESKKANRILIAQIAVAGFAFGNIMMMSFPEYFGFDAVSSQGLKYVFNVLNTLLALPVLVFSAKDYLISAYKNLIKGILHIDFPLALGILVLWFRSLYEIFAETGAGYLDSMTGLIFFLLVGKWFQQRTYQTLRYDRDFKSYFPIAVTLRLPNGVEKPIQVTDLKINDTIVVRNEELIPADTLLLAGAGRIDYSFVTGESMPIRKAEGETIFAGGRQKGEQIVLKVLKPVSQSYLTQLWNNAPEGIKVKNEENSLLQSILNRYFTFALLVIASFSAIYWLFFEQNIPVAMNVFTSVLIIACPCALSLGSQFALGTAMRVLGKHKFYLKNIRTVEKIADIDTVVMDKTGTITESNSHLSVAMHGFNEGKKEEIAKELAMVAALCQHSAHPLSVSIAKFLSKNDWQGLRPLTTFENTSVTLTPAQFTEHLGKGIEGIINGKHVRIGSSKFMMASESECKLKPDCEKLQENQVTKVFVCIDGTYKGYFSFQNQYRTGVKEMIQDLDKQELDLYLLSGDHDGEKQQLKPIFPQQENLHFRQSPYDKLHFIKDLQEKNHKVMMLGDGLNDAGALRQSEVGVAVTESTGYFTPASDAILDASMLSKLPQFVKFSKHATKVIRQSFVIAIVYNLVGLFFAVQGALSPIIAAILMPVSSLTVIFFTTWGVRRVRI